MGTFFAKVFCFNGSACLTSADVGVTGAATYVLPVPMGSPLAYYGVGDFRIPTRGSSASVGPSAPTANDTPNNWSNANGAFADGGSSHANNNTGARQGYRTFGLSVPAGSTIDGIEVSVKARSTDSTGCAIGVDLSWDNGTTYTSAKTQALTGSFPSTPYPTLGGATDKWGRTWTDTQVGDGSFRLRVQDVDPPDSGGVSCVDSARTDLDVIFVKVYYTGPTTVQSRQISTTGFASAGGTLLPSQGFWGAIEGQGSNRSTGDAYATGLNGSGANADYDPAGYDYTIELPAGRVGQDLRSHVLRHVRPPVPATTASGDHWLGNANAVSTYFVLWDTNGSALRSMHTPTGFTSGTLFENEYQADLVTGTDFSDAGEPTNPPDCGEGVIADPDRGGYWHDRWWTLGTRPWAGDVSAPGDHDEPSRRRTANTDESFENMWSIMAEGAGTPKVYGRGRMVSYANIEAGGQTFHLAKIDRDSGRGQDRGDQALRPGRRGSRRHGWRSSPRTGTPTIRSPSATRLTTAAPARTRPASRPSAAAAQPLRRAARTSRPAARSTRTRGSRSPCPWPPPMAPRASRRRGEIEAGWWKIRYTVNSGNDTTTWEVSLRGNPVHLVLE